MEAKLIEKTLTYIQCPQCSDQNSHCLSGVEYGTGFGPWYCHQCGIGIMGSINSRGAVSIYQTPERRDPTFVLLRIDLPDAPLFLVIEGSDVIDIRTGKTRADSDDGDDAYLYSDEFFYNRECPPSITLQKVVAVIKDGESDPRGVLHYVATRPAVRKSLEAEKEEQAVRAFQELTVPVPAPEISTSASQQISR